ncbi:epoxide hydrolase. Serine peptidase. MEROPS family S33 [Dyella jiangningensis]|uniref:alpha/beta fold hydrolase n=1 Tax=Dyella sp. AtDHG13 TaxID=1938897 RepID=UPI000889F4C7|nr:alpha/beta hydrolase [Dyella sp. AtDHG13]PXV59124.1 epoxide hydrolase [Dyella sp. AtDHG13]SDK22932.1 epoxide hydrolase. Serine peptidase. MEROPS family S33 [Dyella jiangningensis]
MSAPVERDVRLPHLRLSAQVWGDEAAPPLLALHGWLDNAWSFARLAPLLASRWQVIALELPGHGHSDHLPPGMAYHFVDYVRAVLDAIDALGFERLHLMGHSLGAGIASLVAAAKPDRIDRLLLIEGLGPIADDAHHTLRHFRDAMASTATGRSLRAFPSIDMAISARTLASGLPAEQARPIVERGLRKTDHGWHWRSDARVNRPSAVRLAEAQVRDLLRGIEAPTALLLAQPDTPYLPGMRMRERAACVGDIAVTHLEGGHHLQLEHPDAVAAWANAHLDGRAA